MGGGRAIAGAEGSKIHCLPRATWKAKDSQAVILGHLGTSQLFSETKGTSCLTFTPGAVVPGRLARPWRPWPDLGWVPGLLMLS